MNNLDPIVTPSTENIPVHTNLPQEARDIHVKGVPRAVWCRARFNALLSDLSFKDYVIRLLAEGSHFRPANQGENK